MSPLVRPAEPADAPAIADLRVISWRATYGPYLPVHVWDDVEPAADAALLATRLGAHTRRGMVAEIDGVIRAFVLFGPCRDDDLADAGEIYALHAHPQHWSTGLGRALLPAALDALGSRPVVLWVLENNVRARRFYERGGFSPDGARKPAELLGGVRLPELRYRID